MSWIIDDSSEVQFVNAARDGYSATDTLKFYDSIQKFRLFYSFQMT